MRETVRNPDAGLFLLEVFVRNILITNAKRGILNSVNVSVTLTELAAARARPPSAAQRFRLPA